MEKQQVSTQRKLGILGLLCITWVVYYFDKIAINVAAIPLAEEFGLSESQIGLVISSFFLSYALMQPVGGWLSDKFGSRKVILISAFVWSLFTVMTGFAWSFVSLLIIRFLFGIGEGSYPSASTVAEVLYLIRAPRTSQVEEIYQRVCDIAKGAALMTGTQVEIVFDKACSNLVGNSTLEKVMHQQFSAFGVPEFTTEEIAFAEEIRGTLTEADIKAMTLRGKEKLALADFLLPNGYGEALASSGSTDVGDVSWIVPTAQCVTASMALGTPFHTWQLVAQGGMSIGHKGMLHAAKVLAATAYEVMTQPGLLEAAKAELSSKLEMEPYVNPIPEEVKPSARK